MKDPIGWEELDVEICPVLDQGTPEEEREGTASPRLPREQLRCWVRGNRYVRVCRVEEAEGRYPYAVHHGKIGEDDHIKALSNDLDDAVKEARILMRKGGY